MKGSWLGIPKRSKSMSLVTMSLGIFRAPVHVIPTSIRFIIDG